MSYNVNVSFDGTTDDQFEIVGGAYDGDLAFGMGEGIQNLLENGVPPGQDVFVTVDGSNFDLIGYTIELYGDKVGMGADPADVNDTTFYVDLSTFNDNFDIAIGMTINTNDCLLLNNVKTISVTGGAELHNYSTYISNDTNGTGFGELDFAIDEGEEYTIVYIGSDGNEYTINITAEAFMLAKIDFICFTRGTSLLCKDGEKLVEDIRPGDLVWTKDNGYKPVKWVASRKISKDSLLANPHLKPITIPKNSFGNGVPSSDLSVSPQHRININHHMMSLLFGFEEAFVPAKHLVDTTEAYINENFETVEYFHIMFDTHEVVASNNLETESFFVGDTAVNALEDSTVDELKELFPELFNNKYLSSISTARPVLKGFEAKLLT